VTPQQLFDAQKASRARVAATTPEERIAKIRRLERAMLARRREIREAMHSDFRKPAQEVDMTEIYAIVAEARHARRRLHKWMKRQPVRTPLSLIGSRSSVQYEPKGVVLIMSPWNFPFNLTFGPLVSAIAAGNTAILKPSEMTPASSACIRRIVEEVFPPDEVAVVEGGREAGEALLALPFDHIFFTGSAAVGRIVMKAAAEHLSSVTLELGGKSPVVVDRSADVRKAARRVVWGKLVNSGQVCIAPDYVLVDAAVHDEFVAEVKAEIDRRQADERTVMVNERHAMRVNRLIESATVGGATVVTGGRFEGRDAAPTVITGVPAGSAAMEEEIFGPLLPIMTYRSLDEAVQMIAARDKPLVLYIFANDRAAIDKILAGTSAGGTVINHTMIHFYQLNLPFGGVGASGMGRGHGFHGFQAFSNPRGVLEQRMKISPIEWIVPPYSAWKNRFIDFLLRYF
jgi:aldehyde dehydrogenase (NAD+)